MEAKANYIFNHRSAAGEGERREERRKETDPNQLQAVRWILGKEEIHQLCFSSTWPTRFLPSPRQDIAITLTDSRFCIIQQKRSDTPRSVSRRFALTAASLPNNVMKQSVTFPAR